MRAPTIEQAETHTLALLTDGGWGEIVVQKRAELTAAPEDVAQDHLRNAIRKAQQYGQAVVIYDAEKPADD